MNEFGVATKYEAIKVVVKCGFWNCLNQVKSH